MSASPKNMRTSLRTMLIAAGLSVMLTGVAMAQTRTRTPVVTVDPFSPQLQSTVAPTAVAPTAVAPTAVAPTTAPTVAPTATAAPALVPVAIRPPVRDPFRPPVRSPFLP